MRTYSRKLVATLLAGSGALLALGAGDASARTIDVYTHQPTIIDGFESTAGTLACPTALGVRQSDGRIFVMDPCRYETAISQFAPDGTPQVFSTLPNAESSVSMHSETGIALEVDNSGTSSNGNIYGLTEGARGLLKGFKADGSELSGNFPLSGFSQACGEAVDPQGNIWVSHYFTSKVAEYTPLGVPTGKSFETPFPCRLAIDAQGNFYVQQRYANVRKYDSEGHFLSFINSSVSTALAVDRSTGHLYVLEAPTPNATYVQEYDSQGTPLAAFTFPEGEFGGLEMGEIGDVAIRESTKEVYVTNLHDYGGRHHIEVFKPTSTAVVPSVTTELPSLGTSSATLMGTIDLDGGGDATECKFEWGKITPHQQFLGITDHAGYYESSAPCDQGTPISGAGVHQITATLTGLTQGTLYHYRLVSRNGNSLLASGVDRAFRPQGPASLTGERATEVNTDGATIEADVDPNGGNTNYTVEYGPGDCSVSSCQTASKGTLPNSLGVQTVSVVLNGLAPETAYHYRVLVTNEFGSVNGPDQVLRTFAEPEGGIDQCANAFVRKQTKASELPDCRAYELVSAADAGGYDVRSDIVEGQAPFVADPLAKDSVLYTLNFGKVPGIDGEPTNLGSDPYVASRTGSGWQTHYVGINVGFPPEQGPFASTPLEESADLSTLTFGGPDICSPCFADGTIGIPVRRADGTVVQGMAGSERPGSAIPDGYVARQLSADGTHFVFGSAAKFEPDGNSNGDVSIYDRNLVTGATHVVSKSPAGANLTCLQGAGTCHSPGDGDGIAELGMSEDGSRIVVAQRVSTDAAGNDYWHPYMNIRDSGKTVDLAPGTTTGVIFDGIDSTGSAVLYTSSDRLTGDDHDNSPDIFRATVTGDSTVEVTRVSTGSGGSGDSDSCDPVAVGGRNNWNAVGAASLDNCGSVALAGGAGFAAGDGTAYFLSPEKLDGAHGTLNEPNLYAAAPGTSPKFVATLEPENAAVQHAVTESDSHNFGDFQVTPSGNFAVFASRRSLTGYPGFGHLSIFRYDLADESLACASCGDTGAYLKTNTPLSQYGSNLADDGRVFFTSDEPLALRDSGTTADVYEWTHGNPDLVSTGRSASDSGLVTVSSDGVNAFFFTRDVLVPTDKNGDSVKIYDARQGGGFEQVPPGVPCKASDECHGPGSAASTSNSIGTFRGTGGNFRPLPRKRRKHHRRHHHEKRYAAGHGRGR